MAIDECVWHAIMRNPASTTAQDAVYFNQPLKRCYECQEPCKDYKPLSRYRPQEQLQLAENR